MYYKSFVTALPFNTIKGHARLCVCLSSWQIFFPFFISAKGFASSGRYSTNLSGDPLLAVPSQSPRRALRARNCHSLQRAQYLSSPRQPTHNCDHSRGACELRFASECKTKEPSAGSCQGNDSLLPQSTLGRKYLPSIFT